MTCELRSGTVQNCGILMIINVRFFYILMPPGIAAVLFQEGEEFYDTDLKKFRKYIHPCTVVSTSLSKQQLRWSTREKEDYAIYWSVMTKLRNHVEGRHFTLRTDHQNLLYISEIGSQKVNRWWYELQ